MHFTKSYSVLSEVAVEARSTLQQKQRTVGGERWQRILEDPTFRRLIRDGHQATATTSLLEQIEDEG